MKRVLHALNATMAPWLVLACSLVISCLLWRAEENSAAQQAEALFQLQTKDIESAIAERLRKYELMLQGCIGLFNASDFVGRYEWKTYVQSLDPLNNYAGIQGIGFAKRVPAAERQAHIRQLRSEGFPEYAIWPAGDRAEYFPIIYLEPFDGRNLRAFSYDMFSEPVRREAMEQARDRGVTIMSGKVTLTQETTRDVQPGFLMYLPLYEKNRPLATVPDRRNALRGFVYSPFRVNDFMKGILRDEPEDIAWLVYDRSDSAGDSILFRSFDSTAPSPDEEQPPHEKKATLELFGKSWILHFKALPSFEAAIDRTRLRIIVCVSLLVSFLLYAITLLIVARGKMLAAEIIRRKQDQAALRASEQRFRTLAEKMQHFVWEADTDGIPLYANKRFYDYTGLNLDQSQAGGWLAVQHPEDAPKIEAAWRQAITASSDYDLESRFREASTGAYRWFRIKGSPVRDAAGRVFRWVGTCTDVHEQKRAEEALRESEDRLRFALETIQTGAWDMDLADHTAFRSREHDRIFGYAELLPKWTYEMFLEHVLPEDRAAVDDKLRQAMETQGDWYFECRIRRPDGQVRWILAAGRHRPDAAGVLRRMSGIVQDITARKRAEEALKKSERLYRAIGESIDYGVWVCAPDGRNIYASESFLKLVGLSQEQCSNFGWGDVLHPDDAERTISAWKECVLAGGQWDIEHRFRGVDGKWHHILARGGPVRDEQGTIECWAGINLDISAIKLTEKALRDSELRLRRLYESGLLGVSYWNMDGLFTDANDKFLEMVGYSREDLLAGRINWISMTPPECRYLDERSVAELKATGVNRMPFEKEYIRKDGSRIPAIVAGAMLDEERFNGVSFALDITIRKKAETELREKTMQLEEANRELETFGYSVSHDLQSPLRVINGFAGLILKKQGAAFDEDTRNKFSAIMTSAKKMGQLIDDLLNLSRIGKKAMDIVPLSMAELAGEVWKQLQLIHQERNMSLEIQDMPGARGDMRLLFLVYLNLLGNAVKFTKHCPAARIEAAGYTEGNENVFYIRDNGAGFDMADYKNLFGVFQRLHSPQDYEGTGIGLAIVQRIIHKHGGRVWAEGKEGEGATFYFTLPRQ